MTVLYRNDAFLIQFFEKGFCFPENSFQNYSIENVQNFHWLCYKTMRISQTEGYLENL